MSVATKKIFGERDLRLIHLLLCILYKERIQQTVVQWIKEPCQLCEPLHSLLKGKSSQKPQGAEGSPDLELDHGWQRHASVLAHGRCDDSAVNLSSRLNQAWDPFSTQLPRQPPLNESVGIPDADERSLKTRWWVADVWCGLTNTEMSGEMPRRSPHCSFKCNMPP